MATLNTAATAPQRPAAQSRAGSLAARLFVTGLLVALVGVAGSGAFLVRALLYEEPGPSLGIVGYVLMPGVAVGGMVAASLGAFLRSRARAVSSRGRGAGTGGPPPVLGIAVFGTIAFGSLGVVGATSYRAIEYMDSPTFCSTCHTVMQPQVEAHRASPHAEVACTSCHIASHSSPVGPNLGAYINAKIGGIRQTAIVLTGSYERPVFAPADKIPETVATCEQCHAPDNDYGFVMREYKTYLTDETNTGHTRLFAFRVGDGKYADGEDPEIHRHASADFWYRSADELRQVITWARVERADGSVEEWVNPSVSPVEEGEPREMSCIDCHNRAGHRIATPEELVDQALADGRIDAKLPYVKREALALLGGDQATVDPDALAARFKQVGWFEQLAIFYGENYPEIASARAEGIAEAIQELKRISELVLYPDMRASWATYPDNLSHRLPAGLGADAAMETPGCFRCHGTLVSATTGEKLRGTMGGDGCMACHGLEEPGLAQLDRSEPAPVDACSLCHMNVDDSDPLDLSLLPVLPPR